MTLWIVHLVKKMKKMQHALLCVVCCVLCVVGNVECKGGGFRSWAHNQVNKGRLGFAGRNIVDQKIALSKATEMISSNNKRQMLEFRTGPDSVTSIPVGGELKITGELLVVDSVVIITVDDPDTDIVVRGDVLITIPAAVDVTINNVSYDGSIPGLSVHKDPGVSSVTIDGSLFVTAASAATYFFIHKDTLVTGSLECDGNNKSGTDCAAAGSVYIYNTLTVQQNIIMNNNCGANNEPAVMVNGEIVSKQGNITMNYNVGGSGTAAISRLLDIGSGDIIAEAGSITMAYNRGGDGVAFSGYFVFGGGAGIGGNGFGAIDSGTIKAFRSVTMHDNKGGAGVALSDGATGGGAGIGGGGGFIEDSSFYSSGGKGYRIEAQFGNIYNNVGGAGGSEASHGGGGGAGFGGGGGATSSPLIAYPGGDGATYSTPITIGSNTGGGSGATAGSGNGAGGNGDGGTSTSSGGSAYVAI